MKIECFVDSKGIVTGDCCLLFDLITNTNTNTNTENWNILNVTSN